MADRWEEHVTDPKERRVFEALSDPEWDFRTVPGLARAAALPEEDVTAILTRHADLVRRSPVRDEKGRELYALRSRGLSAQELLAQARTIISKSVM